MVEVKVTYITCPKCGGLFDYMNRVNLIKTQHYFEYSEYYYKCPYCKEEDYIVE